MHEFSLLASLLKKIEQIRQAEQAESVTRVAVQIGPLAHISAAHFREHFDHAVQNTPLAGAQLEITLSTDPEAPDAQDILLLQIDVC